MNNKRLYELYHSKKNVCCKCGCELEDVNGQLGSVFVLDKDGNFYCTECDGEFEDGDERIFETEFCQKIKVDLNTEYNYHQTIFAYGDKYDIQEALETTRKFVEIWLEDNCSTESNDIPDEYKWCCCDEDFYVETLRSRFDGEFAEFDDELSFRF